MKGMRVIEYPLFSETIAESVWFHAFRDSRFKTNRLTIHFVVPITIETASLNALLSKILRRSCRKYPDYLSLAKRLESLYGAYIEAGTQKRGDCQIVTVSLTGIDDRFTMDEAVSLPLAELLRDLVLDPIIKGDALNPRYLDAEKKSLSDAIDALLNDKRSYSLTRATRILCGDDPAGISSFGEKEEVQRCTAQELLRQYRLLLKTAAVHIMFTGCGNYEPVLALFRDAFFSFERAPLSVISKPLVPTGGIANVKEEMELLQAKLVLGYTGQIAGTDPLLPAMRVAVSILGGMPMSKLFVNVREKKSLCYYCAARYDVYKGTMLIDCGVEQENVERAKQAILEQVSLLQEGAFTAQEMEYAVLSLKNAYQSVYESDVTAESFFLNQILSGTHSEPEEQKALLFAVTREDVIKAARQLSLQTVYLLCGKGGDAA